MIDVPGATIMVMGELEDVDGGLLVERAHISISPPGRTRFDPKDHGRHRWQDIGGYRL